MNQKDRILIRKKNLKLLDTDAYRPKINCLEIDVNNTFKHELGKFLMDWMVKKGVPADCAGERIEDIAQSPRISYIDYLITRFVESDGVKLKAWEIPKSVSEARMKDGSRIDQFILDTGQRIEIVNHNDKSVVPYDKETVVVRV